MGRQTVTAPSGETWHVRRLWAPRLHGERLWSRLGRRMASVRRPISRWADTVDGGCLLDALDDLAVVLALCLVVLLLFLVGVPLILALVDVLVLGLLTVLGILARVAFGRPWVVEATRDASTRLTWRIVGWRASGKAVEVISRALAHGYPPPGGYEVRPRPGAVADR